MADETFSYSVKAGAAGEVLLERLEARMGDGYVQRSGVGINGKTQDWNVAKRGPASEINPVKDFIDRHGGWKSFNWTPPNGVAGLYVCAGYSETANVGTDVEINMRFEQTWQP